MRRSWSASRRPMRAGSWAYSKYKFRIPGQLANITAWEETVDLAVSTGRVLARHAKSWHPCLLDGRVPAANGLANTLPAETCLFRAPQVIGSSELLFGYRRFSCAALRAVTGNRRCNRRECSSWFHHHCLQLRRAESRQPPLRTRNGYCACSGSRRVPRDVSASNWYRRCH